MTGKDGKGAQVEEKRRTKNEVERKGDEEGVEQARQAAGEGHEYGDRRAEERAWRKVSGRKGVEKKKRRKSNGWPHEQVESRKEADRKATKTDERMWGERRDNKTGTGGGRKGKARERVRTEGDCIRRRPTRDDRQGLGCEEQREKGGHHRRGTREGFGGGKAM